jgi:hypothetical protein
MNAFVRARFWSVNEITSTLCDETTSGSDFDDQLAGYPREVFEIRRRTPLTVPSKAGHFAPGRPEPRAAALSPTSISAHPAKSKMLPSFTLIPCK